MLGADRRHRSAMVDRRRGGADGGGVPKRPARPRARPRPERAPDPLLRRPRELGPPGGLAAEQSGVRRVARPGRHRRLCPPRARAVSGRRVDRPLLPRPAIGRGPRTRRRCRARCRRLRRPRLAHQRRGSSVPLPPPALVRAAARRHRRDRRLPVLLPRSRSGLQSSGLGAGLRAPRGSGAVRGGVQGGHPGRAHGGDQRSVARLRGQRAGPGAVLDLAAGDGSTSGPACGVRGPSA